MELIAEADDAAVAAGFWVCTCDPGFAPCGRRTGQAVRELGCRWKHDGNRECSLRRRENGERKRIENRRGGHV